MKKNSNKSKILISIIIIFLMITSVLGFISLSSTSTKINYKGLKFKNIDDRWIAIINNQQIINAVVFVIISLAFSPEELPNNPTIISLNDLNSAQKIYVTSNPTENTQQAQIEFFNNLMPFLSPILIQACTEDIPQCSEKPLKTCQDATPTTKIILFKESNQTLINYQNNCLTIQGKGQDLIKKIDSLVLYILGLK